MLDIKFIRENSELVANGLIAKGYPDITKDVLELDIIRRDILVEVEALKSNRNKVSQEVGILKKQGANASSLIEEMKLPLDVQERLLNGTAMEWLGQSKGKFE